MAGLPGVRSSGSLRSTIGERNRNLLLLRKIEISFLLHFASFLRLFLRMQNGSYGLSGDLKPSFLHSFSRSASCKMVKLGKPWTFSHLAAKPVKTQTIEKK